MADDFFDTLERWNRMQDTARTEVGDDVALANRVGTYAQRYWWMPYAASWSLAKAGISAEDPTAAQAASVAAHMEVNSGMGFQPIGSPVTAPAGDGSSSDVGAMLNQLYAKQSMPEPDPNRYAAGSGGQLQKIAGDEWGKLDPSVQSELSGVSLGAATVNDLPKYPQGHKRAGQPVNIEQFNWGKKDSGFDVYRLQGIDNLSPAAFQALDHIMAKAVTGTNGARYGQWGLKTNQFGAGAYQGQGDNFIAVGKHLIPQVTDASPLNIVAEGLPSVGAALRGASMVLSAPLQEVQGQVRNAYQIFHDHELPNLLQSQSDLGVALDQRFGNTEDGFGGGKVDTGGGIFVGAESGVAKERLRREQERGLLPGGHVFSIGRGLANIVSEPGSKQYQFLSGAIDAVGAFTGDPAARAMKVLGEARVDSKLFTEAGGISGLRPMVTQKGVDQWIANPKSAVFLDKIAETEDPHTLWRAFNRQGDPAVYKRLAEANTRTDVANVLREELGPVIRSKPTRSDFGLPSKLNIFADESGPIVRPKPVSRWMSNMPSASVDPYDLPQNALELERYAALTKNPDALPGWFNALAQTTNPFEVRALWWETVATDTAEHIMSRARPGITAEGQALLRQRARQLTSTVQENENLQRVYSQDAVGRGLGMWDPTTVIDGERVVTLESHPHSLAQHLDGDISLFDPRALRRALSPLAPILENKQIQGVEYLLTQAQQAWKGVQISTVKTLLKVIGDEQAGVGARGFVSLSSPHPIQALSLIMATKLAELPEDAGFIARLKHATSDKVRWAVEHVPGVDPEGTMRTTALGETVEQIDKVQKVAAHGYDMAMNDRLGAVRVGDWQEIHRTADNMPEFTKALAGSLAQDASSADMRGFARAGSLEQAQAWFWDGPGKEVRLLLSKAGKREANLVNKDASDRFVDLSMQQMQAKTNGNPDLWKLIAEGHLDGTPVWAAGKDGTPQLTTAVVKKLANYEADFPLVTRQQKMLYSGNLARKQIADGFFGQAVQTLLGTPSAVLSKSPFYRQVYWERMADNAAFMSSDAQQEMLRVARGEANVGKHFEKELVTKVTQANRTREPFSGQLTLEQADTIAKGHALHTMSEAMDEMANRNQFLDMIRLITPFGEVWRKTIKRWAGIVNEHPQTVRRLQQGLQAAHGTEFGSLMGQPAGEGFFHTDQNGQEVFTIPGSEWAMQALTGAPVPMVGNVQGLSIGTEFFPALGPVASIPVAWTLAQLHAPPQIVDQIFPYGPPKQWNDLVNYMPTWMQRAVGQNRPTSADSVRTFDNTVKDYLRLGITAGDYDMSTPVGISTAWEDATNKAHELNWIRSAAQFLIPGAPSPQMLVYDPQGKTLDAMALVQEYHDLQNQDPQTASQIFLDKYGPNIFGAVTPKSYSYIFGIPTSRDSADWVDAHSDVKRDFPHIYGYFAPPSDASQFDYELYRSQLQPDQGRAAMSAKQWAHVFNSRLAGMYYGKARDKVDKANNGAPPDAGQRAYLADIKQKLIDHYPGYADSLYGGAPSPGLPSRPEAKLLVDEALKAIDDPTVRNTDAGKGLASYAIALRKVDEAWMATGKVSRSWTQATSDYAVELRAYMRKVSDAVSTRHAQFGPLFENVFAREMRDDTNPNALTPGG